MSKRGSRVRAVKRSALRAGAWLGAATLVSAAAEAQQADAGREVIDVYGKRLEQGLGTRYTAPLLEMPQTITLVPREIMDQQNLLTMRDVLSTLPGITFTAGEGGGGYGDRINLRGYAADNDISLDGVRDSAQYSRTDPFNLEQLELVSGANSVYTGAGSVGGSINLVSKTPRGMESTVLDVSGGGDSYARFTLDTERSLGELVDFRLNLMKHRNDVPGRDVERYERWGIAPSLAFGTGTDTRVTLAYVHQEDDNVPQYGVPYALGAFNDGPLPGAPTSAYYGYRNIDTQQIELDAFTVTLDHAFNDHVAVRNLTRLQQVEQYLVVDPPQGTWCLDSGIDPWTGAACAAPGTYLPGGPRGNVRDTTNEVIANQTDFTLEFATGAIRHTLVAGFSLSSETYHRDNGNLLRNPLGAAPNPVLAPMSIANPDNFYAGPVNFVQNQAVDGDVDNRAAYVFDRVQLTDRFEINAGLRYEHNDGRSTTATFAIPYPEPPEAPVATQGPIARNVDDLSSYRVGFVFKPTESSSIYLAQGNSETPSQSSVNGACDVVASCNVDPEEAEILEIGGKWQLGGNLTLTAALFRNERTNFRVDSGDPSVPEQQLDGASRVDGIALGASGTVGRKWSLFGNYTYLDSELLQNVSDVSVRAGVVDFRAGDPLPATPEHSASFWAAYRASNALMIGFGATYQGEYTFNRASETADLYFTPDYWVYRAMVAYSLSDRASLQLNVDNLTDEEYFERVRNNPTNGWATPGAARSAVLRVSFRL